MKIDLSKLKVGIWYTDENGNRVPERNPEQWESPDGAVYAHVSWPLEVREEIYRLRPDGHYGGADRVMTGSVHIGRANGRLIVAMVNSGDYDLYDAIGVYANCCERCANVLWNKYLPEEDGYPEFSEEWYRANTECDFCRDEGGNT